MPMNTTKPKALYFRWLAVGIVLGLLAACSGAPVKTVEKVAVAQVDTGKSLKPVLTEEEKLEYKKGVELISQSAFDEAKVLFQKLLSKHPNLAGAIVNLGLIAEAGGDKDDARGLYQKALDINPENSQAAVQLALIHQSEGDFQKSERLLLNAFNAAPKHPIVNYNLGVLYELYLRDYDQAIRHYKIYLENSQGDDRRTVERWVKMLERK